MGSAGGLGGKPSPVLDADDVRYTPHSYVFILCDRITCPLHYLSVTLSVFNFFPSTTQTSRPVSPPLTSLPPTLSHSALLS